MACHYRALPADSALKRTMRPVYATMRRRATPGWRALMQLDTEDAA